MFTHDAEEALAWSSALVNMMPGTLPGDTSTDTLTTLDELTAFFADQPWTGRFDRDATELEAVRALRPVLRLFWESDEADVVRMVNTLLADAGAVPQIVDHDSIGWHIHATPMDA